MSAVTFSTDQVIKGISSCSNTKAFGHDKLSIFHLNSLGTRAIEYLTALFNDSVTSCRIPAILKSSIVIPIPKLGKDFSLETSYRPISILCPAVKVMEALMLNTVNTHLLPAFDQDGFRPGHSTTSALLQLTSDGATGFNQRKPPHRTICVARCGGFLWFYRTICVAGSNDSRLHVVEPPRGRSFIWQIGVNSSIQDQRQVWPSFFCVESIMHVNAASLDIRDATTSTPGTLNDLTTDLIMANNNNNICVAVDLTAGFDTVNHNVLPRNIQSHNKTHTRVHFYHMVTTSIRHKHKQTTDNTKHPTQNSNWVYNRHKHTTSTRRKTHSTHTGTPLTTRITYKTKISTPPTPTTQHHNTTNNTHT